MNEVEINTLVYAGSEDAPIEEKGGSMLRRFATGIAAINLPLNSSILEVTPLEQTGVSSGELTDNSTQGVVKNKNSLGVEEDVKITSTITLSAEWLPFGSNRFTPPNVRRGEEVEIWKQADADKYYWSSSKYDPDKRKLETVIYLFSNNRAEGEKSTSKNSVYLEVSTHNKTFHLRWNNSDGEPHAWDIQLNAKDSKFIITDDIDNTITISSLEKLIELINTDGSYLRLDGKNFIGHAVEDMRLSCGGNYSLDVGGNMTHQAAGTWGWKTSDVTGTYPKATYDNAETSFTGNIRVANNTFTGGLTSFNTTAEGFEVRGNGTFTGNFKVNGDISMDGDLDVDGNITAQGTISGSNI